MRKSKKGHVANVYIQKNYIYVRIVVKEKNTILSLKNGDDCKINLKVKLKVVDYQMNIFGAKFVKLNG